MLADFCDQDTHFCDLGMNDSWEEMPSTVNDLLEEGACKSENNLTNWKTGVNLCISQVKTCEAVAHVQTISCISSVMFQVDKLFLNLFKFHRGTQDK